MLLHFGQLWKFLATFVPKYGHAAATDAAAAVEHVTVACRQLAAADELIDSVATLKDVSQIENI